jgi:hypothetical protein
MHKKIESRNKDKILKELDFTKGSKSQYVLQPKG